MLIPARVRTEEQADAIDHGVMPGYPSVSRRVDSSWRVGFAGREIGADTCSIHKRMGDYSARMGAFQSDPSEVSWKDGGPVHPGGVHTSAGRHN